MLPRFSGRRGFRLLGRDDQLSEPRVRHAVLGAIGVETLAAGDAGGGLEAAGGGVEAAMDDLAVARGGLEADRIGAFEHDDLVPGQRQRARRGQPDDPGADHDRFDLIHRSASWDWDSGGILAETLPTARVRGAGAGNSLLAGNFRPQALAVPIYAE